MLAPRPETAFLDPSLEVKFKVVLYLTLVCFLNLVTNILYLVTYILYLVTYILYLVTNILYFSVKLVFLT